MKSFRIKNLHSLSDTGEIEFRMLNLLLGANSSGKSSLLRFFPMLRQSVETPTNSGLLLVGRYVDFGSFVDAVRGNNQEECISFEFKLSLERDRYVYYNDRLALFEVLDVTVKISFAKRSQDNKTFVSALQLSFLTDEIAIIGDEDGRVLEFRVNDLDLKDSTKNLQITTGRGLLPSLEVVNDDDQLGTIPNVSRRGIVSPFTQALRQATSNLFHGRTQSGKRLETVRAWHINTPLEMYKEMERISEDSGWRKTWRRWNSDHSGFRNLRNLIIADWTGNLIERVDESLSSFASQTRYVAPVRASADRYMRNQEVAVDEIEPDGRNLPMFLSSLPVKTLNDFRNWTESNLGFSVQTDGDIHLSLRLREKGTNYEFNLADTGFGFSQVLPILVQAWMLTQKNLSSLQFRRSLQRGKRRKYLIAIEQPELHLHPALQARLIRVIISAGVLARDAGIEVSFFIETHSETIVNQIGLCLNGEILQPKHAQVLRFDREIGVDGFPVSKIKISHFSKDGILQGWPFGFFLPDDELL